MIDREKLQTVNIRARLTIAGLTAMGSFPSRGPLFFLDSLRVFGVIETAFKRRWHRQGVMHFIVTFDSS
jgi:hypothetical protein